MSHETAQDAHLRIQSLLGQQQGEINTLRKRQERIIEFLAHYQDEGQPGDVVRDQMAKGIIGIFNGEEVA